MGSHYKGTTEVERLRREALEKHQDERAYRGMKGHVSADRLRSILNSWGPTLSGGFATPAAHVAKEQVRELVSEVQRLRTAFAFYADHKRHCPSFEGDGDDACTCGFVREVIE